MQAPALEQDSSRASHSRVLDSACLEQSLPSRMPQGASFQHLAMESTPLSSRLNGRERHVNLYIKRLLDGSGCPLNQLR